jgi:transcriptional regulator with XRE-family HTH domain
MDIGKQIGQRIRAARELRGMTQDELGHFIGKTKTAISGYENGKRAIHLTELPELAKALDVSIGYFFGENNYTTDVKQPNFTPGHVELINSFIDYLTVFEKQQKALRLIVTIRRKQDGGSATTGIEDDSLLRLPDFDYSFTFDKGTPDIEQEDSIA